MSINKDFQFSHNWNNKLDNDVFTTLRLSDRWQVGDQGDIFLKHIRKGRGEVVLKTRTTFGQITDGVAYVDTGYDANTWFLFAGKKVSVISRAFRLERYCIATNNLPSPHTVPTTGPLHPVAGLFCIYT